MYDLVIVGAGPAGMTAAIYAARRKINFLVISMDVGGQMSWSSEVENYPGIDRTLTGIELTNHFRKNLDKYKIKIKSEEVLRIKKGGVGFVVETNRGKYEARAVIVATGKKPRKLGVPGEEKFLGKGLNYCATCDAPLYKGKVVAVVGGGNSGMEAVLFLAKYAKKVYLLEAMAKLGGEKYLQDRVLADEGIEVITGATTTEIVGNSVVEGIRLTKSRGFASQGGSASPRAGATEKVLKVDGVFVEIGLVTDVGFVDVKKNKWGEIMLFRGTRTHNENLTSVPGIFAAGDCTDIPAKQIIAAAGEGCKAALAAMDWVMRK
ncbi:MAG: FAD-dependent oxidoreductase [archaeon]